MGYFGKRKNKNIQLPGTSLTVAAKPPTLDIDCCWGAHTAFAAKNYGYKNIGVTLAAKQTPFGNGCPCVKYSHIQI